jgi:predicted DNA-binding ribbon-helix-helix protein
MPELNSETRKPSPIVKRSIHVNGHKTSVSVEDDFWNALKEISAMRRIRLSDLVSSIELDRQHANLSSVLRVFVLEHYRR